MFADDTKLWIKLVTEADVTQLQDDLNSLCDWSKEWLLQFNPQKCVVMHIGHGTDNRYYVVLDRQKVKLKPVTEKVLGLDSGSH